MVIGFIQWQLYGSQEIVIYSEENNEYKISLHLIQYRTIWIIIVLSIKQGGEDWASREYNHSSLCADKLESIVYSGHNSGIDCAKLKKGWMQSKCWVASIMEVLQLCPERASIKGILIDAHFEWIFRLVVVAPQIFWSRRSQPYRYPDGAQQRQELHPRQRNNCTDEPIIVESPIIAAPRSFKCLTTFLPPSDLWKSLALHLHAKSPQLLQKRMCGIIERELVVAVLVKTGRCRRRMHDRTKMKRFHFHAESLWILHSSVL